MMKYAFGLAFVAALCFVVGCGGSKLKTEMVEGVVTLDGTPIEGATVTFSPADGGTGVMASGITDKDGKYSLTSQQGGAPGKGAVAGSYEIGIVKQENVAPQPTQQELEEASKNGEDITKKYPSEYKYIVPKKYLLPPTSGLTATVPGGTYNFELTSE